MPIHALIEVPLIWLRCGNTSNEELKRIFTQVLPEVLELLENANDMVEISAKGTTSQWT